MAKKINKNSPVTKENMVALLVQEGYNLANTEVLVDTWFKKMVSAHPEDNIKELAYYFKHL
ncbi:hypothetical protein CPL00134L_CDS0036 [Escherichia phage Phagiculus]